MKNLFLLIVLLAVISTVHAEQKRPSWSQGLPEREQTTPSNQPNIRIEQDTQNPLIEKPVLENVVTETPAFEMQQFDAPQLNYEVEYKVETDKSDVTALNLNRRSRSISASRFQNRKPTESPENPLHKEYSWEVLNTTPIELPSHLISTNNINIEIYIKPNGSVSRVTSTDPNVSSQMLKLVSESVRNWQFEAPKKIGITDILSKNFDIEIKS